MRDVTPVASHWWIVTAETGNGPGDLLYFWGRAGEIISCFVGKTHFHARQVGIVCGCLLTRTGKLHGLVFVTVPKNGQFQLQLPHTLNVEAAFRLDFS